MCVIIIGTKSRPALRDLKAAEQQNPDGAGIAWTGKSGVSMRKGLTALAVHQLLDEIPENTPYVIHFRFATVGEPNAGLCHPFAIGKKTSLATQRDGLNRVLFHNGTWRNWRAVLDQMPNKPSGEWSDSRAIAFILGSIGEPILDDIPCKFAVMDNEGTRIYPSDLSGWVKRGGVLYSNMRWLTNLPKKKRKGKKRRGYHSLVDYAQGLLDDARERDKMDIGTAYSNPRQRPKATTKPQPNNPRKLGQTK